MLLALFEHCDRVSLCRSMQLVSRSWREHCALALADRGAAVVGADVAANVHVAVLRHLAGVAGARVTLAGGDYGFAWTPHGTNAKDLEYFVKVIGMSTMEALLSATAWGGPMMKMGKSIGYVREGCFADLLLVDGDPLADITIQRPNPAEWAPSAAKDARVQAAEFDVALAVGIPGNPDLPYNRLLAAMFAGHQNEFVGTAGLLQSWRIWSGVLKAMAEEADVFQ